MRSGFVAVAGRPNVGKSTLVNALCGGKVAIVSDKPQTTRRRIFGIANGDGHQLVLADLPGFQRPRDPLTEHMQRTVDSSFEDVDAVLGILYVNAWHNLVHIATGALGLLAFRYAARQYALGLGVVYVAVAIWGFIIGSGASILWIIPVNSEDNVLHLLLGLTGIAAGLATPVARRVVAEPA